MQTLYIDVYFLINFTVDILALHLASEFTKTKIKSIRLILFTLLLSVVASIEVFLPIKPIFELLINVMCIMLVICVPKYGIGMGRRFRFFITAYSLLMLIGGIVFAIFNIIKKYSQDFVLEETVNRKLLMLAVIVLISVGCVKIFVSLMKDAKLMKNVKLGIYINDKFIEVDSFVDTGNFLKDPIDSTPVIMLKEKIAKKLFPFGIPCNITDDSVTKYTNVRLIPIKSGDECEIRLGFRPKRAVIISKDGEREVNIILIIDNERGSYGGYDALVPASLIE